MDNIVTEVVWELKNKFPSRMKDSEEAVGEQLRASEAVSVPNVSGDRYILSILVYSAPSASGSRSFVLNAATESVDGTPFKIHIYLNGDRKWKEWYMILNDERYQSLLTTGLKRNLYHELTHAADFPKKRKKEYDPEKIYGGDFEEILKYLNDPREVRAHMQEIVFDVKEKFEAYEGSLGRENIVSAIKGTPTWKEINLGLTSENKKLIFRAVYRALADDGWVARGKR